MQFLQVVERGVGSFQDVPSPVIPGVLLQAENTSSGRHELPDTGSLHRRFCLRVECRFDHRQQRNFHRHATFFNLFNDMEQIRPAAFGNAFDMGAVTGKTLLMQAGQAGIGFRQLETFAYPRPKIFFRFSLLDRQRGYRITDLEVGFSTV